MVRLLCWDKGGAGNVAEGDDGGHLQGHTSGEGTDLFMYVHEEGVRAPAAHLFDGVGVDVSMPFKCMAMAPPARREWLLTSLEV